ncbi:MAG: hypothetical protein M4579_001629 [Chaenotheca gracillima]|nr:MAG: hypothetical protein M4579_001629 [Chaenotheca gracillima]
MGLISLLITYIAPIFIIISPLTSYSDQIWSIHKTRSSAGFSLDIPLIMLVASILRVFYWLGEFFDTSLLVQALIMICVQVLLLKVALDNRPLPGHKGGVSSTPFVGSKDGDIVAARPYNFWQWRSPRPYWQFLGTFTVGLFIIHLFLSHIRAYIALIGYLALSVEATLPIPQVLSNQRARSCKGFRFSVLFSWIFGDIMKMVFFFFAESPIPWAFKICGMFQFACDLYLGVQYWQFGEGPGSAVPEQGPWPMREKA